MHKIYKNFLTHDHAWDLACSIDSTPSNWFDLAISTSDTKGPAPLEIPLNVGGYRKRFDYEESIRNDIVNGRFAYQFHKTTPHVIGCYCWECTFKKEVLMSDNFRDFLVKETSLTNPALDECFTSAYYPKDFLGQHQDDRRGIAFIFHLSWDWKPEYGGLFHVENEKGFDTYVPGWGDLVLMELGEKGHNHFVSEVTEYAPRPRLAISGWFSDEE